MRHIKLAIPLIPALLGMLLISAPREAEAQYYGARPAPPPPPPGFIPKHNPWRFKHRPHFYVNAELTGLAILGQQLDDVGTISHGAGFGIGLGVRTGRWVSIEGNWTFTAHDEIWSDGEYEFWEIDSHQIQTVTLDAKIHIPTWGRAEPFFQVGVGWAFFGLSGFDPYYDSFNHPYMYTNGPTFSVGGGGEIWFGPHFSLGIKALYRGMYFGESEYSIRAVNREQKREESLTAASNFINALSLDLFGTVHF